MKNRISIILVSLVCLIASSVLVIAENHKSTEHKKKSADANSTTPKKTEEIVFTGIPEIKLRVVNGTQDTTEKLSQAKSIEYKCTITKIDDKYYWTTRENVELIPIQSTYPEIWTTFIAANGSGYVRVVDPEMKKIFYKDGELPYDYMEHLLLNLSTITYYGTSK